MGGHIPAAIDTSLASVPHARSGKLKALATFSDKRLQNLPAVPTIAEAGYPGAKIEGWLVFLAPANLPGKVEARLAEALGVLARRPDLVQRVVELNLIPEYGTARRSANGSMRS